MAGKAIGEFSFKLVAINNSPGPAGSVLIQVSWEGTGTGFGAIFNTVTYVGGPKNGTFSEAPWSFQYSFLRSTPGQQRLEVLLCQPSLEV